MQYAAEAIYLSLPLKAINLTSAARMSYALAATHLGRTEEAYAEYQKVTAIPVSNPRQKHYAALNCCGIHLMRGEDFSARKIIDLLKEGHPEDAPAMVTWQYARALSGLLDPEEEIAPCPRSTYDVLNRALQLLMISLDPHKRDAANDILSLMRNWRPKSELHDATSAWIQTTALLHLDKPYLAAQRVQAASPFYPLAELLVTGAKIEIGLHHEGLDLEPLGDLCRKVQALFDRLPSQEARDGLAAKFSLWHPRAAAFVALSPYSVYELVAAAMPSVFTDGRPIQVYGRTVTTHLPFVQLSLEAFGLDATVVRDQSVERKRMADVLNVPWGTTRRMLPVVPPSLLIYHYLRLAEKEGPLWRRAARELAHSHGTVPTTNGGHLRTQRATLEDALQRLLDAEIDTQQFSRMIQALHRRRRAA
ncbi:hypothetical protein DAERI_020303 [Deinococcus aerius]|uniref:Tetratricopeptide repeat protein n=1 Tax=Deinococcus aerius TaxID=200253 RepID=A0A2I9D2J7_9DEIO|nr:hypothetical protein [Deinococcus aerius]GBF04706.1 hypothetical protein DAERI_020303 [Deinococcus aerius]